MGAPAVSIEGPNELNGQIVTFNGAPSSDPAVGAAIQRFVAQSVRANSLLAGKLLINISLTNGAANWENYLNALGDLSGSCDRGNWHVYFNGGAQPTANLTNMRQYALRSAPNRPSIYTETGYFTAFQDSSGWGGCDEATQAKNTLNLLAATAKMGIAQTFLYELLEGTLNPSSTDIENTFGLFHSDGSVKPVATAIHNLFLILADSNPSPTTALTPTFTFTGLPSTALWLLLSKGSNVFELLVWNEAPNWDFTNKRAIAVPPTNVTLTLSKPMTSMKVYDPVNSVNVVQIAAAPISTLTFPLADRMQVIELTP